MRVWLALPPNHSENGGNWVSARRLAEGLEKFGVRAFLHDADEGHAVPDVHLVHAFHAYKAGSIVLPEVERRRCPFVITLTGTDMHHDLSRAQRRAAILAAFERSDAIVVMRASAREFIAAEYPQFLPKVHEIAPAFQLPEPCDVSLPIIKQPGETLVLLVAGIRAVKRPLLALQPIRKLRAEGYAVRLLIAGAEIDKTLVEQLQTEIEDEDGIVWLGEVDRATLSGLYHQADIMINTSLMEGVSNALLEGMSLGLTPLVSAIPGNLSVIEPEVDGLAFHDERDFTDQLKRLLDDPHLRHRLGRAAKQKVHREYSLDKELQAHIDLYRMLLETDG